MLGIGSKNDQTVSNNFAQPTSSTPSNSGLYYQAQAQRDATVTPATTESASLARDIKEGVLNGFIGESTVFKGEAQFEGRLRVDGHFSGHVSSENGTLIVGTSGQIDANIEVAVAQVNGAVNGDIVATERIEMGRDARVNGNIQTPSLVIQQGAIFEGACRMMKPREMRDRHRERDDKAGSEAPAVDNKGAWSTTALTAA
jgi:cytoskeletal protein CcmA (bactofilin family)